MNFLITGITGFVGPHLAKKLLDEEHKVFGLIRGTKGTHIDISDIVGDGVEKIEFLYGDFLSKSSLDRAFIENKFDGVFHLGAQSHPPSSFKEPRLTYQTNALGTVGLCESIQQFNSECVLMNCSTSEVYGICEEGSLITEDFLINPMNPYGVSKAAADLYVLERTKNNFLKAYITRAFSHTGPRRAQNFSIASDAIQVAKIVLGKQDPIIRIGNLESKRVVMDVRDVVDVYYKLMLKNINGEMKNGEIFNVSGNGLCSMRYFLDVMLNLFSLEGKVTLEKDPKLYRPIDIPVQNPDSSKMRQFLNWEPKIPIERTLEDLVNYWIEKVSFDKDKFS